jgi:hypothetical protein
MNDTEFVESNNLIDFFPLFDFFITNANSALQQHGSRFHFPSVIIICRAWP